jgi:hypothetical protein
MPRSLKIFLVLALILALAVPAWAYVEVLPPALPPRQVQHWTPVPGARVVLYAPNVSGDLFRHKRHVYYYYGGNWYRSKGPYGPWKPVRKIPKAILKNSKALFQNAAPLVRAQGG